MRAERRWLAGGLTALLLAGCTVEPPEPTELPSPSATPLPRDFTVTTSGPLRVADPALALGDTDALLVTNLYQRLMLVDPTTGELKPDAATDCIFSSETVYECTLPAALTFHNGNQVTSSDVRFSIQRALRLDVPGTAVGMLDSLVRISAPDPQTVRFHLAFADSRFGYALTSLTASIVDEESFNPDTGLPLEALPIGSGPYLVESIGSQGAILDRFVDYVGPLVGVLDRIRLKHAVDSAAAEAAIADGSTDVVWRSLDPPALDRLEAEIEANPDKTTAMGFTRFPLDGTRVTRLAWAVDSEHRGDAQLRDGVALTLQADRTLSSLVPAGLEGYLPSFPVGGRPTLPAIEGERIILTLRYQPSSPGHADVASLARAKIEELDRVSVRLVTEGAADLVLSDFPAWVPTAAGWLQAYLANPLPGSTDKLAELDRRARTTSGDARLVALGELQKQAAADATVLPVSQADGILVLGRGVTVAGPALGGSGHLGLWGLRHG